METKLIRKLACAVAVIALAGPAALAETTAEILSRVDARKDMTRDVSRQIWEWAEVGYQETQSAELLASTLEKEGFTVERGVAGIPTAFVASWKRGDGPIIAILGEFDALPGINQDAVSSRSPIAGKAAGHACGHNVFAAGSLTAAISIKEWLERTGTAGEIRFYGTPAEEGGSGKVYMVRDGLFDDVDIAIHWHADDENSAAARTSLANRSAKFRLVFNCSAD